MKNLIWCEVKCLRCGGVANLSGWYSPERIKKLKQETKDWVEDEDYSIVCPDCKLELKIEKRAAEKRIIAEERAKHEALD